VQGVIALGDFVQLPPIPPPTLAGALMKPVPGKHKAEDSAYRNGMRLFKTLRMFAFERQERAKGDQEWSSFIDKLREDKTFLPSHLTKVKVLSAADIAHQPEWEFAPIVVGGNEERAYLNRIGVENFALKKGVSIVAWRNKLIEADSTKQYDQVQRDAMFEDPRMVTLFAPGAPAYLNQNISSMANRKGKVLSL
jgi:hypothetical protein